MSTENRMPIPVSILILTKNEERDLPGCLETVLWSDDIHVYDSFSEDGTVAIAEAAGAKVTQRQFDNWAAHQNWGLRNIPFAHPWVLYIDADERVSPELARSIAQCMVAPPDVAAFSLRRRDFLGETWLEHVQTSPFYMRLFRPERMRYERLVNPISLPDGPVRQIKGFLEHYPFSKGFSHWFDRHNSYSTLEARQIIENRHRNGRFSLRKALRAADFHEKRFHQKELFYRLPLRPVLKFLLLYVAKRGFLDGRAGLTYSLLQSFYEYMIVLKTREFEQAARAGSLPGDLSAEPTGDRPQSRIAENMVK